MQNKRTYRYLMRIYHIEQSRFMNLYGHHGARLGREQSIRGPTTVYRTFLISFLSPLLFRAPDTHLRGLEKIWVDKVINQRPWKTFVDTLKEEWIEFILYVSVFVAIIFCLHRLFVLGNSSSERQCSISRYTECCR